MGELKRMVSSLITKLKTRGGHKPNRAAPTPMLLEGRSLTLIPTLARRPSSPSASTTHIGSHSEQDGRRRYGRRSLRSGATGRRCSIRSLQIPTNELGIEQMRQLRGTSVEREHGVMTDWNLISPQEDDFNIGVLLDCDYLVACGQVC